MDGDMSSSPTFMKVIPTATRNFPVKTSRLQFHGTFPVLVNVALKLSPDSLPSAVLGLK